MNDVQTLTFKLIKENVDTIEMLATIKEKDEQIFKMIENEIIFNYYLTTGGVK